MKFQLGAVVATHGAATAAAERQIDLIHLVVTRHAMGDDGDLPPDDKRSNIEALAHGSRIFSAYEYPDGLKLWVITEADRSTTTVLLPEEY